MCEISIGDYKLVILTTLVVLVFILNVIVIFPQFQVYQVFLSIFKTRQAKRIIDLLLLDNFYNKRCHTDQLKKKATNYYIRIWSLVMVRNQLSAQVVKNPAGTKIHPRFCSRTMVGFVSENFRSALNVRSLLLLSLAFHHLHFPF